MNSPIASLGNSRPIASPKYPHTRHSLKERNVELTGQFERYLDHVGECMGRTERKLGLKDYCSALMLPLKRKSIEPLAAAVDPYHLQAMHQSLHHFVTASPWSDDAVLGAVQDWVLPRMSLKPDALTFLIADDSGMPKQGVHSVGVQRQYCGQLGKTESCQVAVSLSIATEDASLPIKYQLYLPESWTDDPARCKARSGPEHSHRYFDGTRRAESDRGGGGRHSHAQPECERLGIGSDAAAAGESSAERARHFRTGGP